MQPANPINSALAIPVSKTGNQPSATAQQFVEESISAFKFEVGQQIQATIQAQTSPGSYKVQIAGQTMQMQLPGMIKVGSQVTLQVVSASPRLTFSIAATSTPISTAEEISSTSKLLSDLTQQPLSRTLVESASGRAIWPSLETQPQSTQLAAALRDALASSGLFYESHQAQWVAGTLSTAQLLTEPQNLLARPPLTSENQTTKSGAGPQSPIAPPPATASQPQVKSEIGPQNPSVQRSNTTPTQPESYVSSGLQGQVASDKPAGSFPIAKELIPLVQQQLHTLETHQLAWSGQVWPNQQMRWEIQGEPEHRSSHPDERQWKTEMELALPNLGDVRASLEFSQGTVRLSLHPATTEAAQLFDRRLPELSASLKNAGIPLSAAVVAKP